uniref:J domain-containing protein n=1 Tax=Leptocylindrus danicus TaxID=163516 RepID=A0A7S2LIA3_9STRA|mmetsp:Transcript_5760/g.8491  ORF Transcript_5760/g.8491 Transcript_5760/m.8491 type:complete len:617 (+) Transcript_5760:174-2024(+)|eukprot:CAMPEP_0116010986 /NCGR_PEP_ID=MMETSP0321-20121206/4310_1 /TAXON_ID=163516 /ORGANISM="Leptocylindrus danicus var. danicus, Strain B650" /LENGTH=616 /DNA_ID=CAMNT_0003480155 /DNA_START=103 /DNA_END=1953 /DNA_ORIENTATION=+
MTNCGLRFILCCCGAFFDNGKKRDGGEDDYYTIVGVGRKATDDEIRKAYKKRSRELHPDKIAQREGRSATDQDRLAFQKMKEAYDVISDPNQRQLYDELGLNGLKMLNDPTSMSAEDMYRNFASSSIFARTRLFLAIAAFVFLLLLVPILMCLKVDGYLEDSSWVHLMIPLWIYNALVALGMIQVIFAARSFINRLLARKAMQEVEQGGDEDDVADVDDDMIAAAKAQLTERIISFIQFGLVAAFEVLLFVEVDCGCKDWTVVFAPLYGWLALRVLRACQVAFAVIEISEGVENDPSALYGLMEKLQAKGMARQSILIDIIRIVFLVLVNLKLDFDKNDEDSPDFFDSWWAVFTPVWVALGLSFCFTCFCSGGADPSLYEEQSTENYSPTPETDDSKDSQPQNDDAPVVNTTPDPETQKIDGSLAKSSVKNEKNSPSEETVNPVSAEMNEASSTGSGGVADLPHPEEAKQDSSEEKEMNEENFGEQYSSRSGNCCNQLLIIATAIIFVAKLEYDEGPGSNDGFSAFWVAFPLLFLPAGIFLCLMGCSIYCVSSNEVDELFSETRENEDIENQDVGSKTDNLAKEGLSSVSAEVIQPQPTSPPVPSPSAENFGDELD